MRGGGRLERMQERKDVGRENIILKMEHVTKSFEANEGVRDFSMEIRKGEVFALVGEVAAERLLRREYWPESREKMRELCITGGRLLTGDKGWIHLAAECRWYFRIRIPR